MRRYCENCKTQLPGPKGHGFVTRSGKLVCGRTKQQRSIKTNHGMFLKYVKTPGCAA